MIRALVHFIIIFESKIFGEKENAIKGALHNDWLNAYIHQNTVKHEGQGGTRTW